MFLKFMFLQSVSVRVRRASFDSSGYGESNVRLISPSTRSHITVNK